MRGVTVRLLAGSDSLALCPGQITFLQRRLSSDLHLISEAEVRHRYGRSCISAPKPTIPSVINTSSPITIQPCNAVMFSSFTCVCLSLTAGIALGLPLVPPPCVAVAPRHEAAQCQRRASGSIAPTPSHTNLDFNVLRTLM
jgi:hypothetical protein